MGGILGLAVGDALGLPFEGWDRSLLKSRVDIFSDCSGIWSDDTSLTLCLAASLSERGYDLSDIAERFCKWLFEGYMTPYGRPVGVGKTTVEAIGRLSKGIPPDKSGLSHERSNGNGSLMRTLPVPLYFYREKDERVVEIAHEVSAITHAHPRSLMACGIYSVFVLHLMRGGDRSLAYQSAIGFLDNYYRAVFPGEMDHFRRVLSGKLYKLTEDDIHSSGYVVDSLEACIWCFLNSEGFEEAVERAIRLGGDTDTIGALTGGLSGMWWGLDSIPKDWVSGLASKELVLSVAKRFCSSTQGAEID